MTPRGDGSDDDDPDRPRRSWREIDRMRDGARESSERPSSAAARARSRAATQSYLKQLDGLFAKGAEAGTERGRALREAHGTPAFGETARAYVDALGAPQDPALATLLLDCEARDLVLKGLEGLAAAAAGEGGLRVRGGLRSQLELLAQDSDDDVAYAAEELLRR